MKTEFWIGGMTFTQKDIKSKTKLTRVVISWLDGIKLEKMF